MITNADQGVAPAPAATERALARFDATRRRSEALTCGLEPEDTVIQSMELASPTGWQLAHTAWFFEEFVLRRLDANYAPVDDAYRYLFNSYYDAVGARTPRDARGLMSRPTLAGIWAYRAEIDARVRAALASDAFAALPEAERNTALAIVELGCHHEEQHQELIVTDLKHAFSFNPLEPAMGSDAGILLGLDDPVALERGEAEFVRFEEGARQIGFAGSGSSYLDAPLGGGEVRTEQGFADATGFAYDNEQPRHTVHVHAFEIAKRPVTVREWIDFIDDGGYRTTSLWLSDAWGRLSAQAEGERAPLYWRREGNTWTEYTTRGRSPVVLDAPMRHVSYDEAHAFAAWSGARLPTEAEWEVAHPALAGVGHVWEWTQSAYSAYPGFRPAAGALGEYNGKFMCGQFVLRGASCATAPDHARPTYRNFFPPDAQWQFSGLRLARDAR